MIPETFLEELKSASDIEQVISQYVGLKRRGRHLTGLCPFHSEKTPSFTVYPDSQSYYCFGCHAGGDVITFIRTAENLEYIEALRLLCERAGLQLPDSGVDDRAARLKSRVLEINREAARFFHEQLNADSGLAARSYLIGRGLLKKTVRHFGIGFAPAGWSGLLDHMLKKGFHPQELEASALIAKGRNGFYDTFRERVMFPIIDLRGNIVGFGGRAMGGRGPKYLNSSDTPVFKKSRHLFALGFAKAHCAETLILGEGYMDVVAMHQAGFENAVATLGTSLTEEQARLCGQYAREVVIAYDSDGAGQSAASRAINLFAAIGMPVRVLELQDAKDPDEFIKKFGSERFGSLLSGGKSAIQFEIGKLKSRHDLMTSEGTFAFLNDFCRLMSGIDNDIQRSLYIGEVSRELDVDKNSLVSTTEGIRKKKAAARRKKDAHNVKVYAQDNAGSSAGTARLDLAAHIAEEKLICLLMKNPDYYGVVEGNIHAEDFADQTHGKIFSALELELGNNRSPQMIQLSQILEPREMAALSRIFESGRELSFEKSDALLFAERIRRQKMIKSDRELGGMPAEDVFKNAMLKRTQHK